MKNNYKIRGDTTAIFIKNKEEILETLIDTNDLPKVMELPYTWRVYCNNENFRYYVYVLKKRMNGKRSAIKLHRVIMNAPKGKLVDHINGNTLDNRKENLRLANTSQNMQNISKANRDNKSSGIRNVSWHKSRKKWIVSLRCDGKLKYFGMFDDINEAARVATDARSKYMPYSKEARDNSLG